MKRRLLFVFLLAFILGLGGLLFSRIQLQSALYSKAEEGVSGVEQFFRTALKSQIFGRDDRFQQDVTPIAASLFPAAWQHEGGSLTHPFGGQLRVSLEVTKRQPSFTLEFRDIDTAACAISIQLLSKKLPRLGPPQHFSLNDIAISQTDLTLPAAKSMCLNLNRIQVYLRY
jgi:hypothetical protein